MSTRRHRLLCALVLLCPSPVLAVANCSVSALPLAFGSYSPFNASATDSTGQVTMSCTLGGILSLLVSYNIRLSTGASGSYAPRRMSNGANLLSYNLYTSVARTTVWGNGTAGTGTISDGYLLGLGTVNRQYTVYGRVPALQNVRGGTYLDNITVTVEY